jgi:glycosyltransferase involved in cell wall biosynthesis
VNKPPFYSIEACKANLAAYLGRSGDWVPIGPQVREALRADGEDHHLSPEDWFNIVDVDDWRVERTGWVSDRPVIGRHSRDAAEKWMTRRSDILAAYPEDRSVVVRILGGATVPTAIIGHRPVNWEVMSFSAIPPRDFLATLDFFVFFPHEQRIEAFGRTIIEAMASGCLAILPPVFEPLFGPGAVYCSPAEVLPTVRRFYADRAAYLAQTALAERIVRERFGFEQHIARLRRVMGRPGEASETAIRRATG